MTAEIQNIRLPDATAMLGLDYQSVYRARSNGKLPFIRRLGSGKGYLAISRDDMPKLAEAYGLTMPGA